MSKAFSDERREEDSLDRQEFEIEAKKYGGGMVLGRDSANDYTSPYTQTAWDFWRSSARHAATLVCGYCADPERWKPAEIGVYPEYWHLSAEGFNVRNQCSAWAIWHRSRAGASPQDSVCTEK